MSELINKAKENVPKVYESGRKIGHDEGIEEGYDNGLDTAITVQEEFLENQPQTYYDTFWDGLQNYGNRKDYNQGFKLWGGIKEIDPKYQIITLNISELFRGCENLETVPKVISTKDDGTFGMCHMGFHQCYKLKSIDFDICVSGTSSTAWTQSFFHCNKLQRIKKLGVLKGQVFNNTFEYCYALKDITIEGTIGQNGFNVQWSTKLNTKSIVSIIEALSDETNGLSVTLSETAVGNMVFPFTSERTGITYNSWNELESTKEKWTITLS